LYKPQYILLSLSLSPLLSPLIQAWLNLVKRIEVYDWLLQLQQKLKLVPVFSVAFMNAHAI
jgi:hypothetical protein